MPSVALVSAGAGTAVAVFNMFYWELVQYSFQGGGGSPLAVPSYYLSEAISIFLLLLGFFLAYKHARARSNGSPFGSRLAVIGSALSDRVLARVAIAASCLYGLLYAFTSSVIVYQPQVDFATAYAATGVASWSTLPCCGDVGTVPAVVLYLSPAHLALQLVPLSVLLLFIVPPLVGLNTAIAVFSVRRTVAKVTGRWMVACGAAVGLFTACPTCAGFFLAESVGGIGAATLAVALAPYQALFIAVSVPLLLLSPLFFARRIMGAMSPVPAAPLGRGNEGEGKPSLESGNR